LNLVPRPLSLIAAAAACLLTLALAGPATARAELAGATYRPNQVVVKRVGHRSTTVRVRDVPRAIASLARRHDVKWAVPNYVAHTSDFIPNDPGRGQAPGGWQAVQWNFAGPWSVNAPAAWQHAIDAKAPGARGVRIAVLDTGVAYANRGHYRLSPDLKRPHFARGYDFVGNDPYPDDENGHGTHVASTINESTNNGISLTGLAYNATIIPVRVLDSSGQGDAATIARGIRWAAKRGAQIINLSLEFSTDVSGSEVPELLDAIDYAHRRGALLVGASGNEHHFAIAYPARADHVLSVGATTEHGCVADFSNRSRGLDMVAPGGGADSAIAGDPNCRPADPPGRDIYQLTYRGSSVRAFGLPGGYEGTSMAVPHVSAVAALVLGEKLLGPHPSPDALEARLKQTARDLGAPGPDARYGWGLLDAAAATNPAIPVGPPPAAPAGWR
jgi:serine protease